MFFLGSFHYFELLKCVCTVLPQFHAFKKFLYFSGYFIPVTSCFVFAFSSFFVISQDGWSSTDREAARAHHLEIGGHTWWEDVTEEHPAVTHQEEIGQKWVADVPAHWE